MKITRLYPLIPFFFAGFTQDSHAAITINIFPGATESTAIVSLSGSVVLPEYTGEAVPGRGEILIVNPQFPASSPTAFGLFDAGAVLPSYALQTQAVPSVGIGSGSDTATFTYRDASSANASIVGGSIINLNYFDNGAFRLITENYSFPGGGVLDAGDLLEVNGSFDVNLGSNLFNEVFIQGSYLGAYNNQDVTIFIPEPSSVFLLGASFCFLGLVRRRSSEGRRG